MNSSSSSDFCQVAVPSTEVSVLKYVTPVCSQQDADGHYRTRDGLLALIFLVAFSRLTRICAFCCRKWLPRFFMWTVTVWIFTLTMNLLTYNLLSEWSKKDVSFIYVTCKKVSMSHLIFLVILRQQFCYLTNAVYNSLIFP